MLIKLPTFGEGHAAFGTFDECARSTSSGSSKWVLNLFFVDDFFLACECISTADQALPVYLVVRCDT